MLIVDDSASVRQTLASVLGNDPDIEVMGVASDPIAAARRIQDEVPDVITLDVEMPRMDGITFLRKLMAQKPIPVVMCSSLTEQGSETLMQALEAGAVDVILKPRIGAADHLAGIQPADLRGREKCGAGAGRRPQTACLQFARKRTREKAYRRCHAAASDATCHGEDYRGGCLHRRLDGGNGIFEGRA